MIKKYLCVIVFLFGSAIVYAQVPFFQHYYLLKKSEPVQVNTIFQDRDGFLWYGTNRGLFKFNGKSYQQLTVSDSLPDNNVTAIAEDSIGRIWTGHKSGQLALLEGKTFQVFEFPEGSATQPISDILFDKQGTLWFSTLNDGLYYYRKNRLFRLDDLEGMPDLFVYDILEDKKGNIWAGTDGGVAVCSVTKDSVQIDVLNYTDGLPDNIVKKLVLDKDETVWMGTEDAGIVHYDPRLKKFSQPAKEKWNHGSIADMVLKDDQLWIASSHPGLIVFHKQSNIIKEYNDKTGYTSSPIKALLKDREGNVWAGSKSGIVRTPGDVLEFIDSSLPAGDHSVMALSADKNGGLWFSTKEGLFHRTEETTVKELSNTPFKDFRVISLYVDPYNYVWAGLYGEGVLRIDPKTGKIRHLNKELRNGNILSITGEGNVVWLATLGGSEKITITGERLAFQNYNSQNGLSSDFIYQVFIDSQERVWFGTDGKGVDMLDTNGFHHFEKGLQSKVVYGFAEDNLHRIWVNVQDDGIYILNNDTFSSSLAQDKVIIRDQNIQAFTNDPSGNIIVIHDQGIDIYESDNKTTRFLGDENGILGRRANLNAVAKNLQGNILFGTDGGIIQCNISTEEIPPAPHVIIDAVRVNGKKIDSKSEVTLHYDENNIIINFLGFWYADPGSVRFSYAVDNYSEGWIKTEDNTATFSQLPPGEYTFRLRATVPTSLQGSNEAIFHFTIRPPFWRTAIFYLLCVLLTLAAGYLFILYRERKLKLDKQELEAKVEERTREIQRKTEEIQAQNEEIMAQAEEISGINENLEMLVNQRTAELEKKNRALEEYAFINAHKLRSPVASILGLVNLLRKTTLNDEAKDINKHLQHSADELDDIVRSITKAIERGED